MKQQTVLLVCQEASNHVTTRNSPHPHTAQFSPSICHSTFIYPNLKASQYRSSSPPSTIFSSPLGLAWHVPTCSRHPNFSHIFWALSATEAANVRNTCVYMGVRIHCMGGGRSTPETQRDNDYMNGGCVRVLRHILSLRERNLLKNLQSGRHSYELSRKPVKNGHRNAA